MKQTRMALIGLGGWGSNILNALERLDEVTLVAVCDQNAARLDAALRRNPHITPFETVDALISECEVDAAVVATPSSTHAKLARTFLDLDMPVFVEKPMALSVSDAEELVDISRAKRIPLMVGHLLIYHPAVELTKTIIDSGELGDIHYIYSKRINLGVVRDDENALWSLAPHDISLVNHFMKDLPHRISAHGSSFLRKGIEDVVFCNLDYPNGCMAQIHVSWLDPHKERKLVVVGSKKMLVFDDMQANEKIRIYNKGADVKPTADFGEAILVRHGDITIPLVPGTEPLVKEMKHFASCVREMSNPLSGPEEGLAVVRVLEAGERSLKNGGEVETLDR
ncbi:MAG: Gfo/Idh/MocA family oxidoreductase [Deltaproteobacteria bacterium]|nr:Gfo/Idh/MocA family oxidoreductase [Candidatus Zymogenaceae bacterium]